DIKTRPNTREIKVRDAAVLAPRELSKLMKENAKARLSRQTASEEGETAQSGAANSATGELETDAQGATVHTARHAYQDGKQLAQKDYNQQFRTTAKTTKQADPPSGGGQPVSASGDTLYPPAPQSYRKEKAEQQREKQREIKMKSEVTETRLAGSDRQSGVEQTFAARPRDGKTTATMPRNKAPESAKIKGQGAIPPSTVPNRTGAQAFSAKAKAHATQKLQRQMAQASAKKTAQATKATAKGLSRLKNAVVRAGKAIVRAAVGLLGGAGGLIALVLIIGGAAAVVGTPFGVFWSGQDADAQSVPQAVAQINGLFSAKISQIQLDNPADRVEIHRIPSGGNDLAITNWAEILAVFAAKTAGANADADDVVTMDEKRVTLLTAVFWDMNAVSHRTETVSTEDGDETVLHITITGKTAEEMAEVYRFGRSQKQALEELLKPEYAQMLAELVGTYGGELTLTPEQLAQMLANLSADLPADRKAVVRDAYSLLGRVAYFWGGKSSAIGWDSRWGTPMKVTAAGSRTTGTIRPYGMDCSGFVDWAFNNALGYVIGHGGGVTMQRNYCTDIAWVDALPGDLVFYPGNSHIGIYVGTDEAGNPLIIHCASSQNNVVITGLQGFTGIGRPGIYSHSS
ncbi:MAG: NlpC/P60 family protein, partial [Oscillospiraceae bacterium]